MTTSGSSAMPDGVRRARVAAVICWLYAAGFGLPTVPIGLFVLRENRLPWLWDLFPMYGGPWWVGPQSETEFLIALAGFFLLLVVVALGAWLLWDGRRSGAVVVTASLPVEAVFWWGFALPIPPLLGLARLVLVVGAWRSLRRRPAADR